MKWLIYILSALPLIAQPRFIVDDWIAAASLPVATVTATCASNTVYGSAASSLNVNDSSGEQYAFTCITNTSQITACGVQFREQRVGTAPVNFYVEIRADNSFAPGTVLSTSELVTGTSVSTSYEWQTKIDIAPVTLSASTRYWVGKRFVSWSGVNYYTMSTGPVGANGSTKGSADGTSWADISFRQLYHTIWAQ